MKVIVGIQGKKGPPRRTAWDYLRSAVEVDGGYASKCLRLPNKPDGTPKERKGYVKLCLHGRGAIMAHRFIYQGTKWRLADGVVLDHLCRNRWCVNVAHLEEVSHRENILRGVGIAASEAKQTHCKRGHEFAPGNTYKNGPRGRGCVQCKRDYGREWMRAKRRMLKNESDSRNTV